MGKLTKALIIFICILCVIAVTVSICASFNDHTYEVMVTDKERINDSDGGKYLIYGFDKDGNSLVFENVDTLLRFKFNSSNIYAEIEEGKFYKATVVGWRIPFLSSYENIIGFTEIDAWSEVNGN